MYFLLYSVSLANRKSEGGARTAVDNLIGRQPSRYADLGPDQT